MRPLLVQVQLMPEQKTKARRKVGAAWAVYWVLFVAMIVGASELGSTSLTGGALVVAWVVSWGYLLVTVSDCDSQLGKSSIVWGGGMFVLGPFGALLLPGLLKMALKK